MAKREMYIVYTKDKSHLPFKWAYSIAELAEITGLSRSNLDSQFSKIRRGRLKPSRCAIVWFDDEEDEE